MNDLSLSQYQIILGGLLGDSSFYYKKGYVSFSQCERQLEYLNWKRNKLKLLHVGNVGQTVNKWMDNEYTRFYFNCYLKDGNHQDFIEYIHKNLYANSGRKKVSEKYLDCLTPLGLAVWWMDDGSMCLSKENRYGKLSTNCFNYEENILIQQYLKRKYDITPSIKQEKGAYFLRFSVSNMKKLISVIYPYVCEVPSMIYKIDLRYVNKGCIGDDFSNVYHYIKSCYSK